MASILLFTSDTSLRAATYTKSTLESWSHTVTAINDSTITSTTPLLGYDLLVGVHCSRLGAFSGFVREVVDAGTPLLWGIYEQSMVEAGGNYSTSIGISMGLYSAVLTPSSTTTSPYILDTIHEVTAGMTSLPVTKLAYSSAIYQGLATTTASYVGTVLAHRSSSTAQKAILAIDSGTNDINAVPIGSRIVALSFLYSTGTVTWTADALTIIQNSVNWLLGGPPVGFNQKIYGLTVSAISKIHNVPKANIKKIHNV